MTQKKYHRADQINERGGVSAICFAAPRAINLRVALWTLRDEAVTCAKCLKLLAHRPKCDPPAEAKGTPT